MDKRISFVFLSLEASGLSYTFIGIACVRKNACKISFALKNFCNLDQIVRVGLNAGSVPVDVDFNQDRARDLSFFAISAELFCGLFIVKDNFQVAACFS